MRNLRYYSDVIHSFDWKSAIEHDNMMVVFKMCDSVPIPLVIPAFVMNCVNGASCSSLLIESTDSMIQIKRRTELQF